MRTMIFALFMAAPHLFGSDAPRCELVGGAISTNFLDQTSTQGVATGSLAGGVGVDVKGVSSGASPGSLVFHNHHRWVTATGGTGRFSGATGSLEAYGSVNNNAGEIVLRYRGRVCHPPNQ